MSPTDGDPREFLRRTVSDLVAIPSPSGQEAGVGEYVFGHLRRSGLAPERDADGNVWAQVGSGRARLHVNAHQDTVVPADGWRSDPYAPRVEGERLYGLGSSDCKSGLAALLWLAPRVRPRATALFSFTVCEEGLGLGKPNGSERMAARGGDWAIACEPTCDAEGPAVSVGTQGHARARVRFRGRAAHSSRPDLGENAIHAAARFCARLEKLNAGFPEQRVLEGAVARATVAPTIISGGRLSNVIPEACEVTVSRRLAPGESAATFEAELRAMLSGEKAEFEVASDGGCALADLEGPLMAAARRALAETLGRERFSFSRGRTDAVLYALAGMDTLTIGPGQAGQCHAADEFVDLAAGARCLELLERLINALPGEVPGG